MYTVACILYCFLIFMFRCILHEWSIWSLCSDISYIDDLFDLNVQIYPTLMIYLISMFRYILHWWPIWFLCSDISSIDDLFDLYCLGDKYELRGSRNLIKEVVSSFKINQENWIHILKGIKKHENTFLFEDLCDILRVKVQGIRVYSLKKKIICFPCFCVYYVKHSTFCLTIYKIQNN